MMSSSSPRSLDPLVAYLSACGGCDRFEFHDASGDPDPVAARAFAESLRAKLGASLGVLASVEQVANRITVCVVPETAAV
jgi:hypothetical protein